MCIYKLLLGALVASYATQSANSQSFESSSAWRKPNLTTSPEDRVSIASAALEKAIGNLNSQAQFDNYGTAGMLYAQMAEFDRLTNQTKYKDQLKDHFRSAETVRTLFLDLFLNYGLIYGYAATRAYAAYKDNDFLNFAADSWNSGWDYTLKQNEVDAKSTPVKGFDLSQKCQGITMAGGTFWTTDSAEASLNGLATGSFLVLSASLAEATANQTYLDAAAQSVTFIHAHLYNVDGVVQDTISANANDSCGTSNGVFAYNSGLMVEGLAILAEVTGNASVKDLLRTTVAATVQNDAWQGKDGVITNGDGILVRGLSAAYYRNNTPSDMRNYIKDYLGVQYNAVLEQATSGDNTYGSSWVGPPFSTFNADNQTLALSALLAAIPLTNDTTTTSSSPGAGNQPESNNSNNSKKSNIGAIVGGVVGGIAFLCLIGGFFLYRRRQKRQTDRSQINLDGDNERFAVQTPFVYAPVVASSDGSDSETQNHTRTNSGPNHDIRQAKRSGLSLPLSSIPPNMSEKERLQMMRHQEGQRPEELASVSRQNNGTNVDEVGSRPVNATASMADGAPNPNMSTAELVRMLNERLQPGQWQEDEELPEYIEPGNSRG